jgi:hypothetical protein
MTVAMNPGGSLGWTVGADIAVPAPCLSRLAVGHIVVGIMAGALSAASIVVRVRPAAGAR